MTLIQCALLCFRCALYEALALHLLMRALPVVGLSSAPRSLTPLIAEQLHEQEDFTRASYSEEHVPLACAACGSWAAKGVQPNGGRLFPAIRSRVEVSAWCSLEGLINGGCCRPPGSGFPRRIITNPVGTCKLGALRTFQRKWRTPSHWAFSSQALEGLYLLALPLFVLGLYKYSPLPPSVQAAAC